jgi:hypothetical protein
MHKQAPMQPNEAWVYKTQAKHTKTKSRYHTGTIWLRNACLYHNNEGKLEEEGWSTGKLVVA